MIISAFNKCSFIDYEGKRAGVIFTKACNMTCPYCHNLHMEDESLDEAWILNFLKKRKGLLEGVVISGGEPCLYEEIIDLIRKIKELGYPVKLDTNGSRPDRVKRLIDEQLVDYIAMDIKTIPEKYEEISGLRFEEVKESFYIIKGFRNHEFRTTLYPKIEVSDIEKLCRWLKDDNYYLQQFEPTGWCQLQPYDEGVLKALTDKYQVKIRGTNFFV